MDIFDKIQSMARQAVDRTGDVIEVQRRKNRIAEEEKKIAQAKAKIGDLIYQQYAFDSDNMAEVEQCCVQIQVALDMIDGLRLQIEELERAAAAQSQANAPADAAPASPRCIHCGVSLAEGARFCHACGLPQQEEPASIELPLDNAGQ